MSPGTEHDFSEELTRGGGEGRRKRNPEGLGVGGKKRLGLKRGFSKG